MPKSAFVAVVGRPSAGKSSLLNALCGWKVAIVSPVPQTTQNTIRGILTKPEGQLVFLDTPGYHESEKKLNKRLAELARGAIGDADIVLYVIDVSRAPGDEERLIAELVKPASSRLVVALNKIDAKGADPARALSFLHETIGGVGTATDEVDPTGSRFSKDQVVEVSALFKVGTDALVARLLAQAPEGEPYYPEEFVTDQDPEFRISEIIREKAMNSTRDEIPHAIYVEIEEAVFNEQKTILRVTAFICVERESQKGIVIGKGASVIKKIRTEAERELDDIFPYRVRLDLAVKVKLDWRSDDNTLKRLLF
jgi:GTPase